MGGHNCLYKDVRQIDTTKLSHVHFAFGDITSDYKVSAGDFITTDEFEAFRSMTNVHRVISFGGWAFSTQASTYNIFRTGVTATNRITLATNIANFVKDKGLDPVNIDWEYPGVRGSHLLQLSNDVGHHRRASKKAILAVAAGFSHVEGAAVAADTDDHLARVYAGLGDLEYELTHGFG